jgi:hypothetical protein
LTGTISGAVRTISAAEHYVAGNYDKNMDPCGPWTSFSSDWIQKGGCNLEWFADYPNTTYWDRVTRFYVSSYGPGAPAPVSVRLDDFRFVQDDQADQVAIANLGAFFDPSTGMLFVTWERNGQMLGKSWEVHVGTVDQYANGRAPRWMAVPDGDINYKCMSAYGPWIGGGDRIFIAVRPHDRETFAQIDVSGV